jgi:hypothetical protein
MSMKLKTDGSSFLLSVVYGPSDDKPLFLDELALLKPPAANPWIVLGDCNLIYEARDKNNLNLNHDFMG